MKIFILFIFITINLFADKQSHIAKHDSISNQIKIITKTDTVKIGENKFYFNAKEEKKSVWADWLPFIAALIVAYATYRGVLKQSKATIAGFRVNWIEDLRVNYSKFLIALRNVDNKIRVKTISPHKYTKDEDVEELNFLKTKIKLMLNHGESEHIAFWEALTQYMQAHNEYYAGVFSEEKEEELDRRRVAMEQLLLIIFKKEWDKAKNLS